MFVESIKRIKAIYIIEEATASSDNNVLKGRIKCTKSTIAIEWH